ncbi:MAG: type II toxin-antitoxin system HicA family toxin [Thermodesulfobacteriota bacterium]
MTGRHRGTLQAVFENPVRANIAWAEIENLLLACGADISEGRGARVRIALNGVRAVFHRPHQRKEADKAGKDVAQWTAETLERAAARTGSEEVHP